MKNRLFIYLSIICNVLSSCGEPIKAKYFSVSWLNYDDSIIKIDNEVLEGTIPVYEGETPIRQDEFYNYIFSN